MNWNDEVEDGAWRPPARETRVNRRSVKRATSRLARDLFVKNLPHGQSDGSPSLCGRMSATVLDLAATDF